MNNLANAPFALRGPQGEPLPQGVVTRDLWHVFYQNQMQINGGKNDRFVAWADSGGLVMGYYSDSAYNLRLWKLAQESRSATTFPGLRRLVPEPPIPGRRAAPGLSGCGQLGGQGPDRPAAKRGSDRHTPAAQAHVPGQRPYRQPAVRPQRALARRLWREYHGAAVLAGVLAQRRRSDAGRSRQPDDHGAARPRQHRRPDDGQGPGLLGTPAAGRPPSIPPPTPAFRPRPTSRRITSPSTTSRAPRPAHRRARRICATAAWATSPRPTNSWPTSRPASCHR